MESKDYKEEIDIQKYLLVFKRRWLIAVATFATTIGLLGIVKLKQEPVYKAEGQLLFQSSRAGQITGYGETIGELEAVKRENNPLDTQAMVIQSLPMLQETIKTLGLKDKDGDLLEPEALASGLTVEPIMGTDILEISYTATDPEIAAAVVNEIMSSFIMGNVKNNLSEAVAAGRFIQEQLPRAKAEVERTSEQLRQFRSQNKIIDLEKEREAIVEVRTSLDEQFSEANSELANITAQSAALSRQVGLSSQQAVNNASVAQASGVQEVLAELQKVQTQLATVRSRYTDEHPSIASLERQEASLKNLLQSQTQQVLEGKVKVSPTELQAGEGDLRKTLIADLAKSEVQRLGLERKVAALSNLRETYTRRAETLPDLEKKQQELDQSLSVARKSYENLLTRQEEIRVAQSQNVGNARPLQAALVPKAPEGLPLKVYLLFGFGGLLLSVAAALFADLIDKSVKTVKEAEEIFDYTLLGLIPQFETKEATESKEQTEFKISPRIITMRSPESPINEAYQMLQANLKFTSSDKKIRVIVLTSSIPQEGKSEVSANLAAAIAQTGRRVVLVDADMRKPSQHHLWGLMNLIGLSNVLVGQNDLAEAVQKVTSHLSVLTAGVIPPNPLNLLDSDHMYSIVKMLSQKYDYVIFDTPPLYRFADAAVLARMGDGVLLVARPGHVDSDSAAAAKALLLRSEPNILGLVANCVDVGKEPYSYSYYSTTGNEQNLKKKESVPLLPKIFSQSRKG